MTDDDIEQTAIAATEKALGLRVHCKSPTSFRQRFYQIRKRLREAGDASLDGIKIRMSPDNNKEIWLINGKAANSKSNNSSF